MTALQQEPGSSPWAKSAVSRVAAPLRQQVIDALRSAILDFQLKPGQRLVERELIEQLGVSRTTVREALRELTSEGLVTIIPQRGAVVTTISLSEAEDLYAIRELLESLLVQRFVDRASDAHIQQLSQAVEHFAETTAGSDDIKVILNAKDHWYEALNEGAASPALSSLIESLQARVRMLRATSMSHPGRSSEAADELRQVAKAIVDRDRNLAGKRYGEHLRNAATTALRNLPREESAE